MLRRQSLTFKVNVRAKINCLSNGPPQRDSHNAPESAHSSRLGEEERSDIAVAGTYGLHDSDFPSTLQNCHHQRVHNADGSDGEGQAAKNSEKQIQNSKELAETARGIEDGECVEAHLLDCILHRLPLCWIAHPHADRGINRLIACGPRNLTQIGGLYHVQALCKSQWKKHPRSRWS